MASFVITGRIVVEGSKIRSKKDALTTLQVMLDDFEDNNSSEETDIVISWDKVEKVTPEMKPI